MSDDDTAVGQDDADPPSSYGDAVEELDTLLSDLESDDVDIDVLARKLRRAAALVRFCRQRIEQAQVDIDQIVLDLET